MCISKKEFKQFPNKKGIFTIGKNKYHKKYLKKIFNSIENQFTIYIPSDPNEILLFKDSKNWYGISPLIIC
jgi:hypothetical protein